MRAVFLNTPLYSSMNYEISILGPKIVISYFYECGSEKSKQEATSK